MLQKSFQFVYRLIFWMSFSLSLNVYGAVNNFDEKFEIEKAIAERLEQALKTRLDKAYFDITVDAQIKTTNTESSQNSNTKVVYKANGEKDILQTWLLKEISQKRKAVEVESIKITLGLSDKVRAEYREDLGKWLNNWTVAVLGSSASSEILVRPTNVLNNDPNSEDVVSKVFTILGTFQNLIGMIFLGGIFLMAFFKSRPNEIKKPVQTNQTNEIITLNATEQIQNISRVEYQTKDQEFLKTLKIRVGVVGKTMSTQVEYLINRWATKENEDLLKIVTLLEALAESGSALENLQAQSLPILSKEASASLSKAFTDLHNMPIDRRIVLLEEIYTELVAGNLVRLTSNQPAFEFLEIFEPAKLVEIFSHLRGPYQVSLLAKMSDGAKRNFINIVGSDFINKLFEASLETHHISDEDLLEAIKKSGANTRKEKIWKSDFTEQSVQKVRQLWAGISRKDETLWLYQFMNKNPEMKRHFENEKNHLAFLGEWSTHDLRKFALKTQTNELAAAIKSLPHLSQPILNVCGIKMRDDVVKFIETLEEPKLSEYFESFTATYDDYLLTEVTPEDTTQGLFDKGAA